MLLRSTEGLPAPKGRFFVSISILKLPPPTCPGTTCTLCHFMFSWVGNLDPYPQCPRSLCGEGPTPRATSLSCWKGSCRPMAVMDMEATALTVLRCADGMEYNIQSNGISEGAIQNQPSSQVHLKMLNMSPLSQPSTLPTALRRTWAPMAQPSPPGPSS